MPTLGDAATAAGNEYGTAYFGGVVQANAASLGPTDLYVTPIIPDASFFTDATGIPGETLRDFTEGQDWALRRIVGKLVVGTGVVSRTTQDVGPRYVTIGAGFFVGRADNANPNVPDTNNAEIDPLGSHNIRQPWIWRRTWEVGNPSQASLTVPYSVPTANNTVGYSEADGPHIDAKTARRIRREERLWFVINAYGRSGFAGENADGEFAETAPVGFMLDYRILGAMHRSSNRSTF